MIKVTQDLKFTLQSNPHIENVYFDKFGNHFFSVHEHKDSKDLYSRIKAQTQTVQFLDANSKPATRKEVVYEANPDNLIVDTLSALEVLNYAVEDAPVFADKDSKAVFEAQASEYAKIKAELEDLKKKTSDTSELEELKAKAEQAQKEKEELEAKLKQSETEKAELATLIDKPEGESSSPKKNK